MADLKKLCEDAGFKRVKTYIASGNVVFESALTEAKVKAALEKDIQAYARRFIPVLVRTAAEIAAFVKSNPFKDTEPARTVAIFLVGNREIYVHYRAGMANTKLKLAAAENGTARNLNTVAKLAAIADGYTE